MANIDDIKNAAPSAKRLYNPKPSGGGEGLQAWVEDTWRVEINELKPFISTCVGTVEKSGDGKNLYIRPFSFIEIDTLFFKSWTMSWIGWDAQATRWKYADVRCRYESLSYPVDGTDAFTSIAGTPSERTLSVEPSAFTLSGGSKPQSDVGLWVPGFDYKVRWHKRPAIDEAFYQQYARYVNSTTYRNCAPGTVLYSGVAFSGNMTIGGVRLFEIEHGFSVTSPDLKWNQILAPDGVVRDVTYSGGTFRHPEVDFNLIFG